MHASYPLDMTMRTARDLYFEVNGFGKDGGYTTFGSSSSSDRSSFRSPTPPAASPR